MKNGSHDGIDFHLIIHSGPGGGAEGVLLLRVCVCVCRFVLVFVYACEGERWIKKKKDEGKGK